MTIPEINANFAQDNGDADLFIGKKFYFGLGIPKNYDVAFKQLIKSAQKGNAGALGVIAHMIVTNEAPVKDFPKDISWLKKLAEEEDLSARKILELLATHPAVSRDTQTEIKNYLKTQPAFTELLKKNLYKVIPLRKIF